MRCDDYARHTHELRNPCVKHIANIKVTCALVFGMISGAGLLPNKSEHPNCTKFVTSMHKRNNSQNFVMHF